MPGPLQPTVSPDIAIQLASSVHRDRLHCRPVLCFGVGGDPSQYQFFPASDRPELVLAITLPQSASMYATQHTVEEVEKLLSDDPDIEHWTFYVGSGPVRFYLPLEPPLPNEFIAQAVIMTKGANARDRVRTRLVSILSEQFPELISRISPLELGPPVGWPIKYRVSGEDLPRVRQLAFEAAKVINSDPHVRDINFDWNETIKVVRLDLYQEKAKQVGVTADVLARSLNSILTGMVVTQIRDVTYLVEVIGRSKRSDRMDLATLRDLHIRGPGGSSVPLSAIAKLEYSEDQPVIWRRKRLPTITIQADLVGAQSSAVVRRLEPKMDALRSDLPAGYSIEAGGIFEDSARALASLGRVVPAMLLVMLVLLMIQLQSFQRLLLVVSVAPLGLIGVVLAMLASGTPMGFIAVIGVIALTGILIRNSVILIDQIEANIASGQAAWDATLEATMQRVRPILLTAGAAMLGMLPIALDVFWGPMAYAMIGGIGIASLLTLVFLPALYVAWFKIREPLPARCGLGGAP